MGPFEMGVSRRIEKVIWTNGLGKEEALNRVKEK
jgi:hypothetical protein